MKYLLSSLIVTLLVLTSCTKEDENAIPAGEDYGCIQRIYIKTKDHAINSADVGMIDNLFSSNKIDNSRFRYYQYKYDTVLYGTPTFVKHERKMVWVDQYYRELRIFKAELLYAFYDDTVVESKPYSVYTPQLDSTPNLSLPRVRKLFRHGLEKYFPNSTGINYNDTCFMAEFGYYKKIVDKHQSIKFYRAWRVFKKNSTNEKPVGFYDDDSGMQLEFNLN